MTNQVVVKVTGSKEGVNEFNTVMKKVFKLVLVSAIRPNNSDDGFHCFIDIDPTILNAGGS
jgi:hypothetical protein